MRQIPTPAGQIPALALGCMRLTSRTLKENEALFEAALACGAIFLDHADIYGGGECESRCGELFALHPDWRDKFWVQSKCGIVPGKRYDFSKAHILEAVDGSLKRLRTDRLDSLLLHRPDALAEPEEVAEAFSELKRAGKVRFFGVSNHNPLQIELLQKSLNDPLLFDQLQFGPAFTGMVDAGLHVNMTDGAAVMRDGGALDFCRLKGITVQAWSPLYYGFFGGVFLEDPAYEPLNQKLCELAEKYGLTPAGAAAAWIARHPARIQTIAGTTSPDHLRDLAAGCSVTLERQEWYDVYLAAGNTLP